MNFKKLLSICITLAVLLSLTVFAVPAEAAFSDAQRSAQNLTVDGEDIVCEKYNIDGNNFFKLRDLAYLLRETGSRFSVDYDPVIGLISVWTGVAYEPTGDELHVGADQSDTAQPSAQSIAINGRIYNNLSVYNIGNYNYFKLRELGAALNFEVGYVPDTNTATVKSDYLSIDTEHFYVEDVDELMDSVGSGRTIYLAPGTYNLTEWLWSKQNSGEIRNYPFLSEAALAWENEVVLTGLEGFQLVGAGTGITNIVAEPRYAVVLGFDDCLSFNLRNMTLGHTPEQGYCTGSVLRFDDYCDDVHLSGLELYGCGTYGIEGSITYLTVSSTEIRDCSYGAVSFRNSYAVWFENCQIHDNGNLDTISIYQSGEIRFVNCSFYNNTFDFVNGCGFIDCDIPEMNGYSYALRFTDCAFGAAEYESIVNNNQLGNPAIMEGQKII